MHAFRSHTCADLTAAHVGETVRLSGWVHRVRDHGGILFIDLRDHYGIPITSRSYHLLLCLIGDSTVDFPLL